MRKDKHFQKWLIHNDKLYVRIGNTGKFKVLSPGADGFKTLVFMKLISSGIPPTKKMDSETLAKSLVIIFPEIHTAGPVGYDYQGAHMCIYVFKKSHIEKIRDKVSLFIKRYKPRSRNLFYDYYVY